MFKNLFLNRKFRVPRIWSNCELKKFANLFDGEIINVSGWKDIDKQGKRYKDYFYRADKYWISNYNSDARGFQGDLENEFFLDLTKKLPKKYNERFDAVFNHTTLEHIYEFQTAFKNICDMSKDIVIIVLPFLQEQHANYGDYWRFSPLAVKRMFAQNNLKTIYLNYNEVGDSSVYVFAIGSKTPSKWKKISKHKDNKIKRKEFIGRKVIKNSIFYYVSLLLKKIFKKLP